MDVGAIGVVPDVARPLVFVSLVLVVDALAPAVFSPVAVADAVGETRGVASAVRAVLFLACSAARLAASSR